MFTKLFTVLATSATALTVTAAPVQSQHLCDWIEGHKMCATVGVGQDHITINGPLYRESGTVTCRHHRATDWSSNGNMTQAEANEFFNSYCSGRGNT